MPKPELSEMFLVFSCLRKGGSLVCYLNGIKCLLHRLRNCFTLFKQFQLLSSIIDYLVFQQSRGVVYTQSIGWRDGRRKKCRSSNRPTSPHHTCLGYHRNVVYEDKWCSWVHCGFGCRLKANPWCKHIISWMVHMSVILFLSVCNKVI